MEYKKVRYSRKNEDSFEIQVDNRKIMVVADLWEKFLDRSSTNLKPKYKAKRIAGMDSVPEKELIKFLQTIEKNNNR